jgi:hypothetical protein
VLPTVVQRFVDALCPPESQSATGGR